MIDTAYDGQIFNIALSDVLEHKDGLAAGDAPNVMHCIKKEGG